MYTKIPENSLVSALEHNQWSDDIEDTIYDCINFINKNNGFTFLFWYSRG